MLSNCFIVIFTGNFQSTVDTDWEVVLRSSILQTYLAGPFRTEITLGAICRRYHTCDGAYVERLPHEDVSKPPDEMNWMGIFLGSAILISSLVDVTFVFRTSW